MNMIDNIELLRKLTSLFGLAPLTSVKAVTINLTIFILQLIYICILAIPCGYHLFHIYFISLKDTKPQLAEFISLLEVSFLTINIFVAWFCVLIYYKDLLVILSTFYELNELFQYLEINVICVQDETIKLIQVLFFIFIVSILNVLEYLENGYNWNYLIVLPTSLAMLYQFINFIIYVNHYYININMYLCKYANAKDAYEFDYQSTVSNKDLQYIGLYSYRRSNRHNDNNFRDVSKNEITTIREIHRSLYELCKKINSFYSVQILLCLLFKIITITIVLYYLISSTKLEDLNLEDFNYWTPRLNKAILCANNFVQLIVIAFVCTRTSEEANFTGVLVHGLMNSGRLQDLKNDLNVFSLQILHQRIIFTAAGFVVLDFTLINSVIGAVTTYLVILIQFQMTT